MTEVEVDGLAIGGVAAAPSLVGREVFVRGRLEDNVLVAAEVDARQKMPFGGRPVRLSLAGFVDKDKQLLPKLRLKEKPTNLLRIIMSDGPDGHFGVFEGRWRERIAAFDVDRQVDEPDIFGSLTKETRGDLSLIHI